MSGEHRVEDVAKVYLLWDHDAGVWRIDGNCDPQWGPLDGYERGADGSGCGCDHGPDHDAAVDGAQRAPLPTLDELAVMIVNRIAATITETD